MTVSQHPILVVGPGGFIGRQVCRELAARGLDFAGISRDAVWTPRGGDLTSGPGQTLEYAAGGRWGAVICVAGSPVAEGARLATDEQPRMVEELLAAVGPCRPVFVFASSGLVYGRRRSARPLTEADDLQPGSAYARAKAACEELLRSEQGPGDPALARIARLFNVAGAGQQTGIAAEVAAQAREIRRGERDSFELRSDAPVLDLTDVRDVASGLVDLACAGSAPPVVNICSGTPVTTEDLVATAAALTGRAVACRYANRGQPTDALVGSHALMRSVTGWQPKQGLADIIRSAVEGEG